MDPDLLPLAGVPLAVKDNFCTRGLRTTCASMILENWVPPYDATVVERLRAAGARIAGSTRMSELGFGLAGDTASMAVAEGGCHAALVLDTMGEARVAAASAGLVGFKPSWGVVSRLGLNGLIPSMECCAVVARDAGEIARVMEAVAGDDPGDFSMPGVEIPDFGAAAGDKGEGAVVGVVREARDGMDRGTMAAFGEAVARIEAAGFRTREVSLADLPLARAVHQIIGSVEASSATGRYDGVRYGHRAASGRNWNEMYINSRGESFGLPLKAYILQGAWFQYREYPAFVNAARVRGRLRAKSEDLLREVDALAFPTRPRLEASEAGTVSRVYDLFAWTVLASLNGQPSLTLPGFTSAGGFDYGLQLVGRYLGDARLLSLARYLAGTSRGMEA
jgi:aspartyl-tRNA(Asn)/glutamyl-tRNA(Gln) amidotransferase subunit A